MAELLRLRGVVKTFPGVRALDGVDLDVDEGTVHCLLGQNGAGKSTLIKVLAGVHRPERGELIWRGEPVSFGSTQAAMRAGIATIYQELDLVPQLSVADNIFLGHEPATAGFVRRGTARRDARAVLARLGHPEIPVGRAVGRLPAAAKQIVSMARALSRSARLLIMDEPSAVLAHDEVANLFRMIRELTAAGMAVVYISHRLEEIRQIGDRVTVLRDGRTSAVNLPAATTPTRELVSRMTGRTIEYVFPPRRDFQPSGEPLLRVTGLSRPGEFTDVSLTVHSGEIVGIAGLVGSGRSELLETIYGARPAQAGQVRVDRAPAVGTPVGGPPVGEPLPGPLPAGPLPAGPLPAGPLPAGPLPAGPLAAGPLPDGPLPDGSAVGGSAVGGVPAGRVLRNGSVGAAVRAGLGMAPEERKSQALLLDEPIYRNITLATFGRFAHAGFTDAGRERAEADRVARSLQLDPTDLRRPVRTLSGGNQQKVVVGRWLLGGTRLLLLDEPTRGVDVGARAELYRVIRALADGGVGVLLVSSEVPEVLGLADRVLVMREGRLIHQAAAADLDEDSVLDLVMAGSLLEGEAA